MRHGAFGREAPVGHIRMGTLPATQKWRQVVAQLELGADVDVVAAAAADAADAGLERAASDPSLLLSFWLLTQVPVAARGPSFVEALADLGLEVPSGPTLLDLTAALADKMDREARRAGGRTDLGEMAQLAAIESLTAVVGDDLPSLFAPDPGDVQRALGRLASGDRFAALAREFFARLTYRVLDYYLSRELGLHVGAARRFASDGLRSEFDAALHRHCREAARIVEALAGGWFGKRTYRGAGVTADDVRKLAPYAFRKMRSELRKRRNVDG